MKNANEILEKVKTMRDYFKKEAQLENSRNPKCEPLLYMECAKCVILSQLIEIIETDNDSDFWK